MKKIIIDCDPGHDDALALIMAFAHLDNFEIKGITTVAGNQTLEKVTQNAANLLNYLNFKNTPLIMGAKKPLVLKLRHGGEFHGKTGMDGPTFEKHNLKIDTNGVEWMAKTITASKEKITIFALGPMTNIAKLIKEYPQLKNKIECISFMGGAIMGGNITPTAEFNIWQDPHSAKIVFASQIPLIMADLGATKQALLPWSEIEKLDKNKKVSNLVFELMEYYGILGKKYNILGAELHDALAIYSVLFPESCQFAKIYVDVETEGKLTLGQTFSDYRSWSNNKANVSLIKKIDQKHFLETLLWSIKKLDEDMEK